jgi:hypothetical protein
MKRMLSLTDVNRRYRELGQLNVEIMGLCCPEEIAFAQKWIDAAQIQ